MASTTKAGDAASPQAGLWAAAWAALLVGVIAAGCRSAVPWSAGTVHAEAALPVGGAAPAAVPAVPPPPPGRSQPRGTGTAAAERPALEPCRDACTFAVLGADTEGTFDARSFAAVWEAAQALAPQHTVVLGSLGRTPDGGFRGPGGALSVRPASRAESVTVFPGAPPAAGDARRQLPCERALLLFLSGRAASEDEAGQVRWLQEQVCAARAEQPILLFLDQPVWERQPELWTRQLAVLESAAVEVHVVAAGTGRFSWWRVGRVQVHTIGAATTPPRAGSAPADGGFPGLIWVSVGAQGTALRVVEPASLLPAEVLDRRLQDQRQALRDACQAGPVSAADGMTEVRCSNPTDSPLAFEAAWHFEGSDGRVEPQMLGFSLEPGQSFRQRFHLQVDRGVPLKFAVPRLTLTTVCHDGLGQAVPLRLDLLPPVRMGGDVGQLGVLFMVDGSLGDWPGGGNPVNHASQVVLALQPWRGPADFMGTLYVGEQGSRLCFALDVRRGKDVDLGCLLLVDPRGAEGGPFDAAQGPLAVTVAPDGALDIAAPRPEQVAAVWRATAEGGVLEVAFDRRLFANGSLPSTILADAMLTRFGASGEPVTALCFSGGARGRESSGLYARFQRPASSAAGGAAGGSAPAKP